MVWTPTAKAKANAKVSKLKTNSKDKTAGPRARTDRQASNREKPGLNKKAHSRQSGKHKSASPSFLSTEPLTLNPKQSYLLFMWGQLHACMHACGRYSHARVMLDQPRWSEGFCRYVGHG